MAWVVLRARSNVQPNFIISTREGPSILTAQPPPIAPPEGCAQPPRNSLRVVRVRACIAPSSIACCARLCNTARVPTRFILCALLHLASLSVRRCLPVSLSWYPCLCRWCCYHSLRCCLCIHSYPLLSLPVQSPLLWLPPAALLSSGSHPRRSGTLACSAARVVPPLSVLLLAECSVTLVERGL